MPAGTKDKLNRIAEYEDQTVSRLAAQAIAAFVKKKEREEHPALEKNHSSTASQTEQHSE